MPYIYQADVHCDECGSEIQENLKALGKDWDDAEDDTITDSDKYPQPYDPEDEADSPQNCATCRDKGKDTFLGNRLTEDGYHELKRMLDKHGEILPDYAKEWVDFYEFSYLKNEYTSAHDWLYERIDELAKNTTGSRASDLVSMTRELASKLDADTIQDLFESDMDSDGYFKKTGWYSSEM